MHIRVWAPNIDSVELEIADSRHAMQRSENGWWSADAKEAVDGADYTFRVNGGPALPDPRSAWQPHGVHGPSRLVDHRKFRWTDQFFQARPLSAAVIYELHVGTFTPQGTFDAVIDRLDHLVELGVSHIELLPVADFPGERGWGYDGVALYAARHSYGGPEGLKRLVDACHLKGLGVILDVVYNHLGPRGNYLSMFAPYFTDRHHTPWGLALNFDGPYSDEVRRFFCDNALMWLRDYHIDGLRLDAVHAIIDTSAVHILEQMATEVDELKAHLGRHLVLIAESDLNDPRVVRPWEIGGFGLDAQWSDDFHHALHTVLTGETEGYYMDFGSLADLAAAMEQAYVYAGRHSVFRQRTHGRPAIGLSGHHFLAYLQNHDQLGNRAQGDRICQLVNTDRVKIGAALTLTSVFVPMLFQGEEWGAMEPFQYFVDYSEDLDLARAITEGRRKEFAAFKWTPDQIPDPQDPATFERSKLCWEKIGEQPHVEIFDWHKRLIALRRSLPGLTNGRTDLVRTVFDEQAQWIVVDRGSLQIVCNLAKEPQKIPLWAGAKRNIALASKGPIEMVEGGILLPAESVAILSGNGSTADGGAETQHVAASGDWTSGGADPWRAPTGRTRPRSRSIRRSSAARPRRMSRSFPVRRQGRRTGGAGVSPVHGQDARATQRVIVARGLVKMDSTVANVVILGLTAFHVYLAAVGGRRFSIKQLFIAIAVCAVLCAIFINLRKAFLELDRERNIDQNAKPPDARRS